jgi:hypothetical protein
MPASGQTPTGVGLMRRGRECFREAGTVGPQRVRRPEKRSRINGRATRGGRLRRRSALRDSLPGLWHGSRH